MFYVPFDTYSQGKTAALVELYEIPANEGVRINARDTASLCKWIEWTTFELHSNNFWFQLQYGKFLAYRFVHTNQIIKQKLHFPHIIKNESNGNFQAFRKLN